MQTEGLRRKGVESVGVGVSVSGVAASVWQMEKAWAVAMGEINS